MKHVAALKRIRTLVRRQLLKRSGILARRMLYPNPFRAPAAASIVDIARDAGVGDVLMCTPVLRAIRQKNPHARIRFYTDYGDLVRGLPYIDEVHPFAARPPGTKFLEYTDIVPSPVHITRLLGDRAGVAVRDTKLDCIVDQSLVDAYRQQWADLPRPRVIALRRASRFTPNKDWPDASWNTLLTALRISGTVIEIGERTDMAQIMSNGPRYVDLRGATSLVQLVAAIAAADIYVGPVSGPMHIAAAVGTPAVLIIGGYEHPANTMQYSNIALYTKVPCAPCWRRDICPFGLKCLHAITSAEVEAAIWTVWQRRQ